VQHDGEGWRCLVAHLIWECARKPMQRSPAAAAPRHRAARTLHEHFPVETGHRPHGFYVRGDGTNVALHATREYEPIESSAGASSSDA
jgi:hypothetical protein